MTVPHSTPVCLFAGRHRGSPPLAAALHLLVGASVYVYGRSGELLHIATVHWQDERWIAPQLKFLRRNLPDHQVWASLNGIDIERWREDFYFVEDMQGQHHHKLNLLAEKILEVAAEDDLLLFVDSDAFPIAEIGPELLGQYPLVAVRRDENAGQPMPHPCFCLTTVGFWREIQGDWGIGKFHWTAPGGDRLTDVGANLLGQLLEKGIEWKPLLRSNKVNLDPLWFGIYGDVVYHHGAGSRPAISYRQTMIQREAIRRARDASVIPASIPLLGRLERRVRYRRAVRQQDKIQNEILETAKTLSDEVISSILEDDNFYARFTEAPAQEHAP